MSTALWVLVGWIALMALAVLFVIALFKRGHPNERDR